VVLNSCRLCDNILTGTQFRSNSWRRLESLSWLERTPDKGEVRCSSHRAPISRILIAWGPDVKSFTPPPALSGCLFFVVVGFLDFDFLFFLLDLLFVLDRGLDGRGFGA
jgi:hypothetical protein